MNVSSGTTHPVHEPQSTVSFVASVLILSFSIVGVISNFFILYVFYIDHQERTSFNVICISRAVSNIYILTTTFVSLFFVITLFGYSPFSPEYETVNIGISITCYIMNEYLSCYVALNRFIAMYFPTYYSKIFGFRITMTIAVLGYTTGIGQYLYTVNGLLAIDCYTLYDLQILAFKEAAPSRCAAHDSVLVVIFFFCLFTCVTVMNLATLVKILLFYNKVSSESDVGARVKMKKNIVLFAQTIFQDLLYLVDIVFTFKLSGLSTNRFWTFLSKTLVWLSIHTLDGIIMMMFNERVSLLKAHMKTSTVP